VGYLGRLSDLAVLKFAQTAIAINRSLALALLSLKAGMPRGSPSLLVDGVKFTGGFGRIKFASNILTPL